MRKFKRAAGSGLAAALFLLFLHTGLKAAGASFYGAAGGLALDSVRPSPAAFSGFRIYEFAGLFKSLGYPDPACFGADEEAIRDLESYTTQGDAFYQEINNYLRFYPRHYDWYGIGPETAKSMVKNIDRVFARTPPLPGDLILFRGLTLKFRANKGYAIGEEFTDKGYVSASTSFKTAKYFAVEKDEDEGAPSRRAVLAIYGNRPGGRGILIDQGEDEVILPHGLKFRVMAKKPAVEGYEFYLVQACAGPCETFLRKDARDFWNSFEPETINRS